MKGVVATLSDQAQEWPDVIQQKIIRQEAKMDPQQA